MAADTLMADNLVVTLPLADTLSGRRKWRKKRFTSPEAVQTDLHSVAAQHIGAKKKKRQNQKNTSIRLT